MQRFIILIGKVDTAAILMYDSIEVASKEE